MCMEYSVVGCGSGRRFSMVVGDVILVDVYVTFNLHSYFWNRWVSTYGVTIICNGTIVSTGSSNITNNVDYSTIISNKGFIEISGKYLFCNIFLLGCHTYATSPN